MAEIIAGVTFRLIDRKWKDRLAALQSLDLALLIHTQNQGILRWAQIETHHVAHLFHKQRVGGKLEGL